MVKYKIINEGNTEIFIPEETFFLKDKKASSHIFYNSNMELNRDITVAIISTYKKYILEKKNYKNDEITYIDAFAASGIRGIRVAKELGISVIINDLKKEAYINIKKNVLHNNIENLTHIKCKDANSLLSNMKASIVDLDPFGSPSRYINSAIIAAQNLLNVTATDTAPLCGAHLKSGIRKYASLPINNEFHSEMGLRILLGFICRSMGKYNKSMNVLFSHVTRHYIRCYLEIEYGIKKVDQGLKNIGYIIFCNYCGTRSIKNGIVIFANEICKCGQKCNIAGPLWTGHLNNKSFCINVINECELLKLNTKKNVLKLINLCINEIETPFYYDYHKICKKMKISAINLNDIIENLKKDNYEASRTHITGTGLKTNAPLKIIENIIANISKNKKS